TATLKGNAVNNNDNTDVMTIDATFSGKTSTPPSGSPRSHGCLTASSSGWYYYPSLTGTITSSKNGEVMQLARDGSSFQVGHGANVRSSDLLFGASGWFTINGSSLYTKGDFNIKLNEHCSTSCNDVEITALKIYDQITDAEVPGIGAITNGRQIPIADLPANYYLVAEAASGTQSVRLTVNGHSNCENVVPYTSPGGGESDNNWNGGVGSYTVNLKAHAQSSCVSICDEVDLTFSIVADECTTYERTDQVNIPDGGCPTNNTVYTINVPDNITISDLNVGIAIDHHYREDINLKLRAPDGTERELFSAVGGNGDDFDILLDSDASTNIVHISSDYAVFDGSPFYEDTFTPEHASVLDDFNGKNAAGEWKIIICDSYSTDAGSIVRAKLEICGGGGSCNLTVDVGDDVSDVCEGDEVTLMADVAGEGSCTTAGESDCNHTLAAQGGYVVNAPDAAYCGQNYGAKLWTQAGQGTSFVVLDFGT
ncbi:MAG: proprotein convertase P-domain-containing protein, partial [Bacteroidota bacterium]